MKRSLTLLGLAGLLLLLAACGQRPAPVTDPELPDEPLLSTYSPGPSSHLAVGILEVSASAHDGNIPENTLDRDLRTRWSALGYGQWIRYDLGTPQTVGAVKIAFYRGDRRISQFDIETSLDNATWDLVYSGQSGGVSRQLETFVFAETTARYVRIKGYGNSENNWNSLTEVEVRDGHGHEVTAVTASTHDGNVPENTRDGNLGTRWSALGDGQWITYDLGERMWVRSVKIAFYRGDRRATKFEIETSRDGVGWSQALSGESSGTTRALETFKILESRVRYVRIVGHKNSENDWNSLTEVEIHEGAADVGRETKVTAGDGAEGDNFGAAVAATTALIVVGAPGDDDKGFNAGAAYLLTRDGGDVPYDWGVSKKLTASDGTSDDMFGSSVAASKDIVIVGAPSEIDDPMFDVAPGAAYIYARDKGGSYAWGEVKKLTANDGRSDASFGHSVAVSGDVAVVGTRHAGSVYVFARNEGGPDSWGQVAELTVAQGERDGFGRAVAVSGNLIVVGASGDEANGTNAGAAYVFARNNVDNWDLVTKLTAADAAAGDLFGESVAVSGDVIVVGASGNSDNGAFSGAAYLFERDEGGQDRWGEAAKLKARDAAAFANFGLSVSASEDKVLIGAYGSTSAAYLFTRDKGGPGNWGQSAKLTTDEETLRYGSSVAVNEHWAVVGVRGGGDNGSFSGAVYVY